MRNAAVIATFVLMNWFLIGSIALSCGYVAAGIALLLSVAALIFTLCHQPRPKPIPVRVQDKPQSLHRRR